MRQTFSTYARQLAFATQQKLLRTGFSKELHEVEALNTERTGAQTFRDNAVASLLEAARLTSHYGELNGCTTIADFPVLEKATLKEDPAAFRSPAFADAELVTAATSGSYGLPLTVQLTKKKKRRQHAEVVFFGSWANYHIGMSHLYLRGWNKKGPLKLRAQNEWFGKTDYMTPEWLDYQVKLLREKKLQAIIGVPSVIALIAHHARDMRLGPQDFYVRGVITSGETLRDEYRDVIATTFGSPCLSRYSAEELGTLAAECPEQNTLHVNEASFILEILKLESDQPADPRELGRIVVTDLFSHAMPLIRYDTGDLGALGDNCSCGRPTETLDRIEGRTVEMISDVKGRQLSPYFLNPIMKTVEGVKQFQFAQTSPSTYELRLVGDSGVSLDALLAQLRDFLGEEAELEIHFLEEISKLPSGKRPYIINEWKNSQPKA